MPKFLFYSDLHLRPERREDCEIVLTQVGELAKKHGAIIINGGDTFNTRGLIRTGCFDTLAYHYSRWMSERLPQVILVGNHDQEDKAGKVHPMRVFDAPESSWGVVSEPVVIYGIAFFPYMPREEIRPAIKRLLPLASLGVAVVHWGIQGADMNDWVKDTDGVPVEWLKGFKQVFSGHYHHRNAFANVTYIGSPMQQSFAEKDQAKGVILFDSQTMSSRFIEIQGTSKHYEFIVKWDENGKMKVTGPAVEAKPKDFVKFKVEGGSEMCRKFSVEQVSKKFVSDNVKIERNITEKTQSRLKISLTEDTSSVVNKYVEFVDTPLDKKRLMKTFQEISNAPK